MHLWVYLIVHPVLNWISLGQDTTSVIKIFKFAGQLKGCFFSRSLNRRRRQSSIALTTSSTSRQRASFAPSCHSRRSCSSTRRPNIWSTSNGSGSSFDNFLPPSITLFRLSRLRHIERHVPIFIFGQPPLYLSICHSFYALFEA